MAQSQVENGPFQAPEGLNTMKIHEMSRFFHVFSCFSLIFHIFVEAFEDFHPIPSAFFLSGCLLLANALASERQEALSDALIERAVAVVGEVQQDELEAPHPTRRVLMPGKLPEAVGGRLQGRF